LYAALRSHALKAGIVAFARLHLSLANPRRKKIMATQASTPNNVPAVGSVAPDFALPADDGQTARLSDYRGQRVVLYFYPNDMTSGCTTQACGFRDHYAEIEEKNAVVLGISPNSAASHVGFKTKYNLPFRLLADEDHRVAELYGVWGEKSNYGKKYFGVLRSHFVIDEEGRIVDVQYKVSPEASVESALASLRLR
jgi:thioredoxin-dependent peroxiredoxin